MHAVVWPIQSGSNGAKQKLLQEFCLMVELLPGVLMTHYWCAPFVKKLSIS